MIFSDFSDFSDLFLRRPFLEPKVVKILGFDFRIRIVL